MNYRFHSAFGIHNPAFHYSFISTSTPADKSRRIKASIVCGVGSSISRSLLWVRISNCSRDFLSTWGLRNTDQRFLVVGKGIGPDIFAPVLFAVSIISIVD